ncbi:MAG: DUF934 domain-containing protein [Betaproteobacteria bacterium]|nr:DUF934 domain-containing protein [Betaproteobacteria bacterium]MDE2359105.1 DUF934 domain-containing protein [Betaproteobacteria bacterium]
MPQLISLGARAADRYALLRVVASLADLPAAQPVIVPVALWTAWRAALVARGDVGVWLAPADDPAALVEDLALVPLIAIDFPQFTDGRGYSHARLLRGRLGFLGELRAIGDIQRDQLYYLAQCGFDAFSIPDAMDAAAALKAFGDFSDGYQATERRLPWFRRRDLPAAPAVPPR